ncbi:hypothetical protein DMN91_007425 [Ooceraea biroi]|uniref:Uncharacterized protein n=1 Tax=Ooceraea biroi TaxID=2015173 RepID=A0A3L8DKB7_OOCBI|nr:hypothetical protein DMN91_007425 [Ooceraea biroi]
MRDAYQMATLRQQEATERQGRYYNLRRRDWRPKAGDAVMKREHPLSNAAENFAVATRAAVRRTGDTTATSPPQDTASPGTGPPCAANPRQFRAEIEALFGDLDDLNPDVGMELGVIEDRPSYTSSTTTGGPPPTSPAGPTPRPPARRQPRPPESRPPRRNQPSDNRPRHQPT